ncbi:hypothetical protein ACLOJK_030085 [Asimina triloba]
MDKLQVLQKLASDEHSSAKIFKAIADPPTTSLQRLKGLTTGGLPTFIDVGNSFGAPAIIEDNLILQLAKNGKRVLMMGDDTWIQLFPDHFAKSYPFPSFNVKDLDTVDNGCIENLLPAMYEEDWDVLIAHFLGVKTSTMIVLDITKPMTRSFKFIKIPQEDHAGHIFGVDSAPMLEKLEQYNTILEKVVEILKVHSGPGGLHENTLLIVMGDHGQTLNGDHGGGTAEEVETSLFAMNMRRPPTSVSPELDTSTCKLDLGFQMAELLPFLNVFLNRVERRFASALFNSIGRVNPELYALSAGTWNGQSTNSESLHDSNLEAWLQNYADVLCINCWQVKRYIDLYSASSVIGFPKEDLAYVAQMYAQAQSNWSISKTKIFSSGNEVTREGRDGLQSILLGQIDAFSNFLERVAELARSKWTEFDLEMMAVGLCVLLLALLIQILAIKRVTKELQVLCPYIGNPGTSVRFVVSIFIVAIRACSFLSNRRKRWQWRCIALVFLLLNFIIGLTSDFGLSKLAVGSAMDDMFPLRILQIDDADRWCIIKLQTVAAKDSSNGADKVFVVDSLSVTQWSLLAAFLIYGLIASLTTTFTIICVTIQRRHLMVWGLFAPNMELDNVGRTGIKIQDEATSARKVGVARNRGGIASFMSKHAFVLTCSLHQRSTIYLFALAFDILAADLSKAGNTNFSTAPELPKH